MKRLACLLFMICASTPAFAQMGAASPYTFTVPVHLENLPETTSVRVSCYVSRLGVDAIGSTAETNLVAQGETVVSVTGGRYNADVTVPTVFRGASASHAASYVCNYTLMGPSAGGGTFGANSQDMYTRATGRAITSSTPRVAAVLP